MSELINLRQQLLQKQHRKLVILSGDTHWQMQQLKGLYKTDEKIFWIGSTSLNGESGSEENTLLHNAQALLDYAVEPLEAKRLSYHLGQEISGAIIDVKQGLSADTLGILAGMITAGGLLVLLTPKKQIWPSIVNPENSRFLNTPLTIQQAHNGFTQHLIQSWQTDDVVWLEQHKNTPAIPPAINGAVIDIELPTQDQTQAIKAIHTVAFGHRKRPLVITADRGRGKSSALGIAAIDCLLDGKNHIVVTASRLDQTQAVFKHAQYALQTLQQQDATLNLNIIANKPGLVEFEYNQQNKCIEFIAPDALILSPTTADLLLVDEAAHLPTPLLTELLMRHHRLVFATTLHGYEGSGRGFELRFKKQLEQHTPDWKTSQLNQPIRWAENDPLEKSINQALLLNSGLSESQTSPQPGRLPEIKYQQLTAKQLLSQSGLLESLFGLLVQAHYQTSPNDLQQLLNAPNIHILVASFKQNGQTQIIGALLCVEEGKLGPSTKRAHGHLVPQLLTKNYAQDNFLMLSTWRIMRIAVHPEYQRNGIGLQLTKEIETLATNARVDYLSSSFGASDELLPFWFKQNFWPLHVGVKRDKASGSHNIVVTKPLSAMARQALALIQERFQQQFPHLLLESLPNLSAIQIWQIIQTFRFKQRNHKLDRVLQNYLNNKRPYEAISSRIWEWSIQSAPVIRQSSIVEQTIWCDKILKKMSWQEVAHQHHLAGRKGVEEALKKIISDWNNLNSLTHKLEAINKSPASGVHRY
ncbi:tRNA(Met) cytidine acetyltransferase TmcA [Thiomicrorhabdus immobilis]|uniref:tRNA(Met) cytidine acetyltransferase TmcA n=1 Tax=Thiomicrorhabdus immobilis TaxID=2791037 RepID=A0ABM7MAI4_9GAMM|nr:GNAT family N-acetyltransferase [Thiomicrorhabdus immobilis]BCN92338.1 tRNA(Met) cytidine acetyltransferase TmcA [Thiomicrorhabdus immobilis]